MCKHVRACAFLVLLATAWPLAGATAAASAGGILDRYDPGDLRVVSYNILFDTIFPSVNPTQAAKFERVVHALDADVWNLQEVYNHSAAEVAALMDNIAPLPDDAHWHAHLGGDNVIVSKYPLTNTESSIRNSDGVAVALVDLPDDRFTRDLYVMNDHFKCCNVTEPPDPLDGYEQTRQRQADALVSWMRDARTAGGLVDLPMGTPMLLAGDFNIINPPDVLDPLGTLITGDVFFEDRIGPDSPPDWDGSPLLDVHPRHNGSGVEDYTWRNDSLPYDPGRLDYLIFTDSVMQMGNRFVLNTVAMTPTALAAAGLQTYDTTVDLAGVNYDHLPLVVDLRKLGEQTLPGDFNEDGRVDAADYAVWRNAVGAPAGTLVNDPTNLAVGSVQYDLWRLNFGAVGAAIATPTPTPAPAAVGLQVALGVLLGKPRAAARR